MVKSTSRSGLPQSCSNLKTLANLTRLQPTPSFEKQSLRETFQQVIEDHGFAFHSTAISSAGNEYRYQLILYVPIRNQTRKTNYSSFYLNSASQEFVSILRSTFPSRNLAVRVYIIQKRRDFHYAVAPASSSYDEACRVSV